MPRRGFILQAKTRWLLLGLAVLLSLMLFMYLLECAPPTDGNASLPGLTGESYGKEYYQALLQEQEEHYQTRATSLKRQIAQLKQELQEMSEKLKLVQDKKGPVANDMGRLGVKEQAPNDLLEFLHSQIDKAEVGTGAKLPSEYSVVPFESFTSTKVYQLEMGLTRHPEEKPIRKDKRDELVEAIEAGLEVVNNPDDDDEGHDDDDNDVPVGKKSVYSESDFVEGYYRTEKDKGTQYELFYKKADLLEYRHVTLFRPFGPLMKVKSEILDTSKSLINIIVPLSGRTEVFTQFMQNFRDVCIHQDKRIHLTVVYFGKGGLSTVRTVLETVASKTSFRNYTLISLNEEFNRGRGLEVGARAWAKGEVLMFFCDVDVYFTAEFLHSCRLNSEPGKKVFYPVVFSLYNPAIVYASQEVPPPVEQQLVHKKDSGFWRDFGFGMTCQFRSDFLTVDPHTQLEESESRKSVRPEPLETPVDAQVNDGDLTEEQSKFVDIVEFLKVRRDFYRAVLKSLSRVRINDLVLSVQQILDELKEQQRQAYMAVKPQNCPFPEAPKNGGLVCVNVNKIHYCKPMCNQGYDFSFLRRSRLHEECGNHTASKWTTQFIGGSRLAVCMASDIAVSGGPTAYFPTDMTCQKASANASMEAEQVSTFLQELRAKHIAENHDKTMDAIICGD